MRNYRTSSSYMSNTNNSYKSTIPNGQEDERIKNQTKIINSIDSDIKSQNQKMHFLSNDLQDMNDKIKRSAKMSDLLRKLELENRELRNEIKLLKRVATEYHEQVGNLTETLNAKDHEIHALSTGLD